MPSLKKTLRYLFSLESLGIKPGLLRIEKLLDLLGNPQNSYPSILVGGTNGKGSTASMIASVLREAGLKKVALYTSPHLSEFNERITVDGSEITGRKITQLTSKIKALLGRNLKPSFFELTTAMAFEYFREKKADLAVLEVGMGGRWDATNVVTPLVSVITGISLDHTRYLGNTIRDIAFEKAGIIKYKGRVVTGATLPPSLNVIKEEARKKKASLYILGRDFRIAGEEDSFSYYGGGKPLKRLCLNLKGRHQTRNAACALKTIDILKDYGYGIKKEAVRKGLKKAAWPGRFEIVRKNPAVILDCAHNPEGALVLKEALRRVPFKKLIFVIGVMEDKDIEGIFSALLALADTVIFTEPSCKRRAGVEMLLERLGNYAGKVIVKRKIREALKEAFKEASGKDCICVTGSIFTVGEARRYLYEKSRNPEKS